ncbi:acetyltransferase [Candidatus Allofournierella excrementigallinarum]|uniref:acetyltransferase n=1 Tax=Candidatus Allofournierella excrementigallinarum TaxID=2838592 RepID=UPI00374F4277
MKTLAIYGAGGMGREVLDLAREINEREKRWKDIVLLNDFRAKDSVNGAPMYTFAEFCAEWDPVCAEAVVALGEPELRALLAQKLTEKGYSLATLLHPTVTIGTGAKIGAGTIICNRTFVSCNTQIGANVLIQPGSCVFHDVTVGDHSVISAFVSLAGHVTIGARTYIGMSVPVREKVTIGSGSIVGMGAVVIKDIPDDVCVYGNPATVIRKNESKRVFR